MHYKSKTVARIKKEIVEFQYLRMHVYVDTFRDMLYEIRKDAHTKITKSDLEVIFSHDDMYVDYTNMLRKKFMFLRAHNALQDNEAIFLISGIPKNYVDQESKDIKPYSYQTYIYAKNQPATILYEPAKATYNTIKVMVENESGYEHIQLSDIFTKRLIEYLDSYDPEGGDCNDFELHMLGTDAFSYHELVWPESRDGNMSTLVPGDCISILKSANSKSKHKAVYIGNNLFISKFGRAHLGISTLEQMHDFYGTSVMTLNRYFRDTKSYAQMKQDRIEMLKTHPDRERLEKVFANVGRGIC